MPETVATQLKALSFLNLQQLTEGFTGQLHILNEIDYWLTQKDQQFFILTGEQGVGKSAIAARLTQFATGEEKSQRFTKNFLKTVHFCSVCYSSLGAPKNFTEFIALQLAQILAYANLLNEIDTKQINIQVR